MTTQTLTAPPAAPSSAPLALHVPEHFKYVDRGLQRASDWVRYIIQPGLYRIWFVTGSWRRLPGNTRDEATAAGMAEADRIDHLVDRTQFSPYYAVAELTATKVASYYENQFFTAVSGHEQEHDEATTVRWTPYAYEVELGAKAYHEWVGEPGKDYRLIHHAEIVELQPCGECDAEAGERCEESCQGSCQGGWDGIPANAGSVS